MGLAEKIVGNHRYVHSSQMQNLCPEDRKKVLDAVNIAGIDQAIFNVIKLDKRSNHITLLDYSDFYVDAFPILRQSWTIDLDKRACRLRTYEGSLNPPIFHRKELLFPSDNPQKSTFKTLTETAEQIGLFDDPNRIGFKRAWDSLLGQRGYKIVGHQLLPIGNDESSEHVANHDTGTSVARHLTALTRYAFSAPLQTLARFGYLDGTKSVFDYGCGRGDDIRGLQENNIPAAGWDPYYAADQERYPANIVNLGFVVNVIESMDERVEAVCAAYALAEELLVVSAMLANQDSVKGKPYGDGVLTSRSTFQKYYTQAELRLFIAEALNEEPLPVGPGIFYVFKDKDAEQRFMYGRLENKRNILQLARLSRPIRPDGTAIGVRPDKALAKYEAHKELLEDLWENCIALGRDPDRSEVPNVSEVSAAFGSLAAALRFIKSRKEDARKIMETAAQSRIDDIRVYFAQMQFDKRKRYSHLESRLQRDIKAFFGCYENAVADGKAILYSLGNVDCIASACQTAADHGIGWLEEGKSLQLHTSLVPQLPATLRAYICCGTELYGDVSSADVVKIHINTGKLSLMKYDDFLGKPLPRMIQRVKLNLRRQQFEVFDYEGEYTPPYLYRKSRFINEEVPMYAEQLAFEESLDALTLFDFDRYGPAPDKFDTTMAAKRYEVAGFQLVRSSSIPALDEPCGEFLKFGDLIHCGETRARLGLSNIPKEPASYGALLDLAINVLDPIIDYFGMIRLTYGFCSSDLAMQIEARIAPKLDQHAACDTNRLGKRICDRGGAAVDFLIEDEDMLEVAQWIAENITFDRLYFYGRFRPIHISFAPNPLQQVTFMVPSTKPNVRIPKVIPLNLLKQSNWPLLQ